MAGTAARCVAAWQAHVGRDGAGGAWGLVAAAFDQRNHGSRVVWPAGQRCVARRQRDPCAGCRLGFILSLSCVCFALSV